MTNREKQFADLGVEYAEGIEQCKNGTVYILGQKFQFLKVNDTHWKGYWDKNPTKIFSRPDLLKLFEMAYNDPISL